MRSNETVAGKRLDYLDSARALAALSIVIWHFFTAFFSFDSPSFIRDSPFRIFWYGDADVTFFFIHSGFILTYCNRQFMDQVSTKDFIRFLISRAFRIYPLYLFVLLLSHFIAITIYPVSSGSFLTKHFHEFWNFRKNWSDVAREAILIVRLPGNSADRYLPQDWTLSVELIVSAFLPFLSLLMRKRSWLCCIVIVLLAKIPGLCTFILEFGAGIFLFHFMDVGKRFWSRTPIFFRWMTAGIAILLVTCFFQFSEYFAPTHLFLGVTPDRLVVVNGCVLCFIVILNSCRLQKLMSWPFFARMGQICYGLYLFHMLLLIVLGDYGLGLLSATGLPLWANKIFLLFIIMTMTIGLSFFSFYLIERPMIKWGKRINARLSDIKISFR